MTAEQAYSRSLSAVVLVLARRTLWGYAQAEVYVPSLGRTLTLPADDLLTLDEAPAPTIPAIMVATAAARIRAALDEEGALLAPLTANVVPLPHQLAALQRAIASGHPRLLLADEVGLGKTIEAGLIMREMKLRGQIRRILVVAPTGLTGQWRDELLTHFGESFQLLTPADFPALRRQSGDANLWRRFSQVICPLDAVKPLDARRGWSAEQVARHNAERLDDLVSAGWDLVIFDEAHRLAGSSDHVARYQLARTLADATLSVLLLSATPHSGKTDAFRRLLGLLDARAFPEAAEVNREHVAPYIVRTPKRAATDTTGAPLFLPRQTRLLPVTWGPRHTLQRALYDAVSDYVREGYNAARRDRRQAVGFLLVLMQRLVSSSTRAIREALERRLDVLCTDSTGAIQADLRQLADVWDELDSEAQLDQVLTHIQAMRGERQEVETLLSLARRCEAAGVDARAEALLDQIYQLQQERNNPQVKVLIFTEFTATQAMLGALLESRGVRVARLNGAMPRPEREAAQYAFAHEAQILVSTDAGGEGLNLQFCSVVVNYDLPWNPMRLEQRIGRVDRIGQTQPVQAINLILADTVEGRVQDVLQQKLMTILAEFGVDKSADVLDGTASESVVERLFRDAILDPQALDTRVDSFIAEVRAQARSVSEARAVYDIPSPAEQRVGQELAQVAATHPLPIWIERLTLAAIEHEGGAIRPRLGGYDLTWADDTTWPDVTFDRRHADSRGARLLTLEESRLRGLLAQGAPWMPGLPVPVVRVSGLPVGVTGVWGLYTVAAEGATGDQATVALPLFMHHDGRLLDPTARWLWDHLLRMTTAMTPLAPLHGAEAMALATRMGAAAEQRGESLYRSAISRIQVQAAAEEDRGRVAYAARRTALERIGLPTVRRARLAELEHEEFTWRRDLTRRTRVRPALRPLLLISVEGA